MNISIPQKLEQLVNRKVASGRYGSASEVVREGLRLLEERDRFRDLHLQELRRDIQIGIAELDRGESAPLDMAGIKAAARKRLAKAARR